MHYKHEDVTNQPYSNDVKNRPKSQLYVYSGALVLVNSYTCIRRCVYGVDVKLSINRFESGPRLPDKIQRIRHQLISIYTTPFFVIISITTLLDVISLGPICKHLEYRRSTIIINPSRSS